MKKNIRTTRVLAVAALLLMSSVVDASSITTTFADDNGTPDGNMFNLQTLGNALNITAFDMNIASTLPYTLDVYARVGGFSGFETSPGAWTLVGTGTGVGAGSGNPSFVDTSDFVLAAGTLYGIYVDTTLDDGLSGVLYTTGNFPTSNADMQLSFGAGIWGNFGTIGVFEPRTWNGTIYYDVQSAVPEPGSLLLAGLGLAAVAGFRRRSNT